MNDLYSKALHEHQQGNIEQAEKLYQDILEQDPNNSEILHLLGILSAQHGDFLNGRSFLEKALAIDSKSSALYNSMGNVLKNLEEYDEAIVCYKAALKLKPDSASAHNNLGNIFYYLDKFDDAANHYREAIKLMPDHPDAYYNLSLVLTKQGYTAEAKYSLEKVLQLQPEHEKAHNSLGYLLQLEGDFERAMHHYKEDLKINEENVGSWHNLGVIFINKGSYDIAKLHFEKALEEQSDHIEALNNMGSMFLLQKKPAEALPYFLRLSKLVEDFDVYYNLGVIYLTLASFAEAKEFFIKALKISPNDFAANLNLGVAYLQDKDFVNAEKQYLKAHDLQPDNEEVLYVLKAIQQKGAHFKAPAKHVKNLFDNYASTFDQHLEMLGYRVPKLLFEEVQGVVDIDGLSVMDLGCGTGLSGEYFKNKAAKLIGIDISEKMLDIARSKDVYTDSKLGSIEDLITDFHNIDVIIASDSLVYFGELSDVFEKCHRVLKDGGLLAFTVELSDKYPYVLQRSARFAHSVRYIEEIVAQNDFAILQSKEIVLRKHGDTIISGNLFILKK